MGALKGFGLRTYRVLVQYTRGDETREVEFGGIKATSVAKAKERARDDFISLVELPEDSITHMFAVMIVEGMPSAE